MAVFATHVVLSRGFQAVRFAPGDELPEWAEGKVGSHCLAPEDSDTEEAVEPETGIDPDAEESDEEPEPDAAPDFTAAAPRRGRPRK